MSESAGDSDGADDRRKRIRQACLNCRRKKVRCGGEKPICQFCSRLSQTCIYAEDGRSNRQSSFTSHAVNDEGLDSLTGEMSSKFRALENRLSGIESTLQGIIPLLSSLAQASPAAQPSESRPRAEPQHQADLVVPVTQLPMTPQATPEDELPPTNTLLFAADVYFRFCHNQPYSLFHEPTFRPLLASGGPPVSLVWALVAAARRYSTLPDVQLNDSDDAVFYAKKAWESLEVPWNGPANDEEAVLVIQTIILIVNIEHPAGYCASAYMKLGFALRIALYSRLNMEPASDLPPIVREQRRRAFWSLYLQDKLISLSRERCSLLRDEDCRVRLPCSEVAFREGLDEDAPTLDCFTGDCLDEEAVESSCPLALIAVMASTLNRVSEYVLQENRYSKLGAPWSSGSPYATISSTLLQLELHLGMNGAASEIIERKCIVDGAVDQHTASSLIYCKAIFHLAHCLLHHPFLLQQRLRRLKQRAPLGFTRAAWDTCRMHAKSLTDLTDMKLMRNHNVLVLTSLYSYCAMVAGTIHALSMNEDNPSVREEGGKHYKAALEFLREISCYWRHAALMAKRLERFSQQGDGRRTLLTPGANHSEHSPAEMKALWESVDYATLSAPTRPGTPAPEGLATDPEFMVSPSQLFDFADFDMTVEAPDAYGTISLPGDLLLFSNCNTT